MSAVVCERKKTDLAKLISQLTPLNIQVQEAEKNIGDKSRCDSLYARAGIEPGTPPILLVQATKLAVLNRELGRLGVQWPTTGRTQAQPGPTAHAATTQAQPG